MKKSKTITNDDILLTLCRSVGDVISSTTGSPIKHSPVTQKIQKVSLRPDFGCFVMFDGGFSGLVIINFTGAAALEMVHSYMSNMGLPQEELPSVNATNEIADGLGELLNQAVGYFTRVISEEMHIFITQNQPKVMSINQHLQLSFDTQMERPQARRVTFITEKNNLFFLEFAMDKTEFTQIQELPQSEKDVSPDEILEQEQKKQSAEPTASGQSEQDLFDELGI